MNKFIIFFILLGLSHSFETHAWDYNTCRAEEEGPWNGSVPSGHECECHLGIRNCESGSTRNGSTGGSSATSGRLSLDITKYTIDGVSATDKINDAKQGKFHNVALSSGGGGGAGGCSTSCDCSGTFEVCNGGTCVDISTGLWQCDPAYHGQNVRGDASCQYRCQAGNFVCPAGGEACP
jgi:hypothetical protein